MAVTLGVVRLVFDRDMHTDSYTCWKSPAGTFPPVLKDGGAVWKDARTFELKLEVLQPDTQYALQLNSDRKEGFAATDGAPLPITTVRFKTAAAAPRAPRQDVYDPSADEPAQPQPQTRPGPAESGGGRAPSGAGLSLHWNAKVGQISRLTQTTRLQMKINATSGTEQQAENLDQLLKVQYREQHLEVADGRPVRVNRVIELAQTSAKDPQTGEVQRQDLPFTGLDCDLRLGPDGTYEVVTVRKGDASAAAEMAESSAFITLEPDGPVKVGDTWQLTGPRLAAVLKGLNATEGSVALRLAKVDKDPKLNQDVAMIEGTLRVRLQLPNDLAADLTGTLTEQFVPEVGLSFLRHVKGTLKVDQTINAEGQRITVRGDGEVEMIQERAVQKGEGGSNADRDLPGARESGRAERSADRPAEPNDRPAAPQPRADGGRGADRSAGSPGQGVYLTLFRDPAQGAFFMLVPRDWKTDGGMVPSGAGWNVVDLIESNIRFRATSPDGRSFFGFYPRFYFLDPQTSVRNSGGILNPQVGGVMNGCWSFPYMTIGQFAETIVFGQFAAQEFLNPRIVGDVVNVPELRAFVPQVAQQAQYGYVEFTCTLNGVPSRGRLYVILANYGSGFWTNIGTWGLIAPADRWAQDERVMEYCLHTFRFDPQWVQKASAAAAQRGQKFYETNRELNEAYDQMAKQRMQRNSGIQEEMYKVLTDQIETRDPQTGEEKWLPRYNRAFTNNKNEYFLTDYTGTVGLENDNDWRELKIINRNQ